MNYISTRGDNQSLSFSDVVLKGLADDGGLYWPETWPADVKIDTTSYATIVASLLGAFTGEDFTKEELAELASVYDDRTVFTDNAVAPLKPFDSNMKILELFHGPTLSFKDYALQLVGRFFDKLLERRNENITVLAATSGDTGSAAIEALKHSGRIKTVILHPLDKVALKQRWQMTTVIAPNVVNFAVRGNFDNCQDNVKEAFEDDEVQAHCHLSAVNSINWLRIIAQSAYYFHACKLAGEPISVAVPTGNFGNILSAWIAKKLGAPIQHLIIGSNRNDVLTRFFETGTMSKEKVVPSLSPSMDIGISSNFERWLFEALGRDGAAMKRHMAEYKDKGTTTFPPEVLARAQQEFLSFRCDDETTLEVIADTYKRTGTIIDPHTAVGVHAARMSGITTPIVIASTAHASKFPDAVLTATGRTPEIPPALAGLEDKEERVEVIDADYLALRQKLLAL